MPLFGPPNVEKMKAQRDVNGLIKALSYPKDDSVRCKAASALGEAGDARAVEPLIAALNDRDEWVRHTAIRALGMIGDAGAVEALRSTLQDQNVVVRQITAEALSKIQDARAVDVLRLALKDKDWHVRLYAAEGLGSGGDSQAIEVLKVALSHSEKRVVEHAVRALDRIGWQPGKDTAAASYWIAKKYVGNCIDIGIPAIAPLVARLKDKDEDVRRLVAETLGKMGSPAIEPVMAMLEDDDYDVRRLAAEILGKIGDARAVQALIAALKDRNLFVRTCAAKALDMVDWEPEQDEAGAWYWSSKRNYARCVEIGDPAVEPLLDLMRHEEYDGQIFIIEALGMIGDPRAVDPLIELLHTKHYRTAAQALVQIYKGGRLDATSAARILAHRQEITNHHADHKSSCAPNNHVDRNEGIAFPL